MNDERLVESWRGLVRNRAASFGKCSRSARSLQRITSERAYWSKVDEDRSCDTALPRAPLENGLEAKRGKDLLEWRRPRQEGANLSPLLLSRTSDHHHHHHHRSLRVLSTTSTATITSTTSVHISILSAATTTIDIDITATTTDAIGITIGRSFARERRCCRYRLSSLEMGSSTSQVGSNLSSWALSVSISGVTT